MAAKWRVTGTVLVLVTGVESTLWFVWTDHASASNKDLHYPFKRLLSELNSDVLWFSTMTSVKQQPVQWCSESSPLYIQSKGGGTLVIGKWRGLKQRDRNREIQKRERNAEQQLWFITVNIHTHTHTHGIKKNKNSHSIVSNPHSRITSALNPQQSLHWLDCSRRDFRYRYTSMWSQQIKT